MPAAETQQAAFYVFEHRARSLDAEQCGAHPSPAIIPLEGERIPATLPVTGQPAPLVIASEVLFGQLVEQFGCIDGALGWLIGLACRLERPVAVQVSNTTTFLSPPGWTEERLQGWAAAHAETVQRHYGEVAMIHGPGRLRLPTAAGA